MQVPAYQLTGRPSGGGCLKLPEAFLGCWFEEAPPVATECEFQGFAKIAVQKFQRGCICCKFNSSKSSFWCIMIPAMTQSAQLREETLESNCIKHTWTWVEAARGNKK